MRVTSACPFILLLCATFAACSSGPKGGSGFNDGTGGSGNDAGGLGGGGGGTDTGGGYLPPAGDAGSFGSGGGGSDAPATTTSDGGIGPVDVTPPCDTGLAVDDSNGASFAKAIGICTTASSAGYGLVSATYSNAFGSTTAPHDGQWGLLPGFGTAITPREGATIGVLSSGYARNYDDSQGTLLNMTSNQPWAATDINGNPIGLASDFVNSSPDGPLDGTNYPTGAAPPGFPKAASGCMQDNLVNDMIDVKLVLKAPMDATGFQFDFDFYSSEWPNYVCSNFNDAFIAYLTSSAMTDNVSFDSNNNPVAVNTNFFNRCTPGTPVGCLQMDFPGGPTATSTCSAGPGELAGTGFADTAQTVCAGSNTTATLGGATGWLTTQAPITGGEQFTLEFMIWDAGDGQYDSSVLIDHFQWIGGLSVSTPVTTRPPQ